MRVPPAGKRRRGDAILAFVCYLQSSEALVLVATCTSLQQLAHLQQHPAVALVQQHRSRYVGKGCRFVCKWGHISRLQPEPCRPRQQSRGRPQKDRLS
jgi:hypothetical protein